MSSADQSRVRPTASSRCSRHAPLSDTPEIKEVQENVDSEDEESKELTGLFSGGPYDISILHSFKTHITADIWNQKVIFFLHNNSFIKYF